MTTARVTQDSVRTVSNATPNARVTQNSVRVISSAINHGRITQCASRIVSTNTPDQLNQMPIIMIIT